MKLFTTIILALFMIGCGGGGSTTNTQGNTSGVITLLGEDSSVIGTTLDTGFVGSSLAAGSQPDYIIIVDKASSVTFNAPNTLTPNIADFSNGFVLVVTDDSAGSGTKGISMSITVDGIKFDYACSTPVNVFIDCGPNSITLDIANKTVTFDNTTVINIANNSVLTMDGALTWTGDNININNDNNNGGALTDITGVWQEDDPFGFDSILGASDEVYEIYKSDGTHIRIDYYMSLNCYDKYIEEYSDLGNGDIVRGDDDPYNFTIEGNTMTVTYQGQTNILTRSTLTESDFTPICVY